MADEIYYFGAWSPDWLGHFLYLPSGHTVSERHLPKDFPIRWQILDASLLPPGLPQIEGRAVHCLITGWTIISFWDRSGDTRMGSNSSFVMRGEHAFEAVCCWAIGAFPDVWNRFKFKVRLPEAGT